jgi:hypothetical protein
MQQNGEVESRRQRRRHPIAGADAEGGEPAGGDVRLAVQFGVGEDPGAGLHRRMAGALARR